MGGLDLILGGGMLDALADKLGGDYENGQLKRIPSLTEKLKTNNWRTYDIFTVTIAIGAIKDFVFSGNTIVIIIGTGMEISFNNADRFFPLDVDTPITDFPFYMFTLRNAGKKATQVKVLAMYRGSI